MKKISEQDQEALLEILQRHEQELKSYAGVHYVDVGYKFVNGKPTDELAIRVHVGDKKPESELMPSQILPRSLEGIPIDVIQSNPVLEINRNLRFDPLVGGVAVRNTRHPFLGTLGAVVYDAYTRIPMGLSNHHVMVATGGEARDQINQPATSGAADMIGTLARWNVELDCAVCALNDARTLTREIVDFPFGVTRVANPVVGMSVAKSGRTTETTFAIIDGVSLTELTMIPDPDRPSPTGEISAGGDSGSVWLQVGTTNAVGLHFAGELSTDPAAERSWAKRMSLVVSALDISLVPPLKPSFPFEPGMYTIQQKSNGRFVDAHEYAGKDYAIVSRTAQNNDTQKWFIYPVGVVCTIQQMSNNRFLDAYESEANDYGLVTRTAQNNDTQKWILKPLGNNTYTIQQLSSRRYMDAYETSSEDFALVTRTAQNNDTQKWILTTLDGETYTIQQKSNDRYMDAHEISAEDFAVVTRTAQYNNTQRWCITPVGVECTIQQVSNRRFVDAYESAGNDFGLVTRTAQNNDTQKWILKPLGDNTYTVQQKSNGRYMDAHEISAEDFQLVTRTAQNNDTQRWVIKLV